MVVITPIMNANLHETQYTRLVYGVSYLVSYSEHKPTCTSDCDYASVHMIMNQAMLGVYIILEYSTYMSYDAQVTYVIV